MERDTLHIQGAYRSNGCEQCAFTGYRGRIGIFELIVVDDDLRNLIMQDVDSNKIRELARRNGMKTLLEDGQTRSASSMRWRKPCAQKAGPNRRAAVRAWQWPILARLRRALEIVRRRVLPQSVLVQPSTTSSLAGKL